MFQGTLAFLFSVMLISTAARADQNALTDVDSADEAFQEQLIDVPDDDPDDGIGPQLKRQPPPATGTCPAGFTYVPLSGSCYMVVYESHNWDAASTKCQQIVRGGHLVAITSSAENDALKTFLAHQMINHPACTQHGKKNAGGFFWTSGQRRDPKSCRRLKSPFVWKPTGVTRLEHKFSYWLPLEPNCFFGKEHCIHIWPMKGFGWNDENCDMRMCPLCEYNPLKNYV